jgi:hypothetical protein
MLSKIGMGFLRVLIVFMKVQAHGIVGRPPEAGQAPAGTIQSSERLDVYGILSATDENKRFSRIKSGPPPAENVRYIVSIPVAGKAISALFQALRLYFERNLMKSAWAGNRLCTRP